MGNSTSQNEDASRAPHVAPSASLEATAGSTIRCAGWVVPRCVRAWSSSAAEFREDILVPPPGPTQVRVKLYAAGMNPIDTKRPSFGESGGFSLFGSREACASRHLPPNFPFPYVMGTDGAGLIESVGWAPGDAAAAERFGLAVGDRVAFLADSTAAKGGTFCQYAVVEAEVVARIPPAANGNAMDFVDAAAMPCAAGAAYVALFDKLCIEAGRTIFINGASGGVGSVAVQMAKYAGLYVIASCSTVAVGFVKSLGADCVLDYTQVDVVAECLAYTQDFGVDYALELSGAESADRVVDVLRFGGAMCVVPAPLQADADVLFRRQITLSHVCLGGLYAHPLTRGNLRTVVETVMELYRRGAFRLRVETIEANRANTALDIIAQGHTQGKIVLTDFHPGEPMQKSSRRRHNAANATAEAATGVAP